MAEIIESNAALKSQMEVSTVRFNLLTLSAKFYSYSLTPKAESSTLSHNMLVGVDASLIECKRINIFRFIFHHHISMNKMLVHNARFKMVKIKDSIETLSNINQLIKDLKFEIEILEISNSSLLLYDFGQKDVAQSIGRIQAKFYNIRNQTDTQAEFPKYDSFQLSLYDYKMAIDSLHLLSFETLEASNDTMHIHNLTYFPKADKYRFTKLSGGNNKYHELKINKITCTHPQLDTIIKKQKLLCTDIHFYKLDYTLFRDYRQEFECTGTLIPVEKQIAKLIGRFSQISLDNSTFTYEALYPHNRLPAQIKFSGISAVMENDASLGILKANIKTTIDPAINANFELTAQYSGSDKWYEITANAANFELKNLNPVWQLFSRNKYQEGRSTNLHIKTRGQNRKINTKIIFNFENLVLEPSFHHKLPIEKNVYTNLCEIDFPISRTSTSDQKKLNTYSYQFGENEYCEELLLWPQVVVSGMQQIVKLNK